MKVIRIVLILAAAIGYCGSTQADTTSAWTPNVEFQLEDADFAQTLAWVSGWSYAMTTLGREQAAKPGEKLFCLPSNGHVESRILLDALNQEFPHKMITSEQAAVALLATVKTQYACP